MNLSNEQKRPVQTESSRALIIAPAGSGKTRVLTSRIKHLIKNNVSPYEIISLTFTRKAAGEMKSRLNEMLGSTANNIKIGTIHGMALAYLQQFGELVGLRPGKITIYSQWEETYLLKDVALELGYHTGKAWKGVKKGNVDRIFHTFYTTGFINPDMINEKIIMSAFFARCRENNALTYGTILTTFLDLIPKIGNLLNLRHILCDECQDNDPLQWQIINLLCSTCDASLFAVGDFRQSIFGFRGADPEYMIRNQDQFDIYNLQDNYRSSANIVEAANNLISHNNVNIGEPMTAKREEFQKIRIEKGIDSDMLKTFILTYKDFGILDNTAILARNHWMLEKLSRLLTEAKIKHEYIGKTTGLVRSENFRRFHSFFKLIVNPFDNFSFLLIREYLGLSSQDYKDIRWDATVEYDSHFNIWRDYKSDTEWQKWFQSSEPGDMATIIDWMKDIEFGFDTESIFAFIHTWMLDNYDGTIDQYLNWLAVYDVSDEIKEESEGLQLMTAHSSKGLEFSTVILIGLNEGIFPSKQSISKNDIEEERRLAYVAWTRAEDQLILTSRPLKKDDNEIKNPVSRFIKESLK